MPATSVKVSTDIHQLLQSFFSATSYTQVGVLTDSNTRKACYPLIEKVLPSHQVMEVKAGEDFKNLTTCTEIWSALTEFHFDRHALLVVLGGGVLGDMGGFCAATFKRGIDFVLIPTTLLSQVDASVGGKLGIDFQSYKNHIGVFQEPKATLISTQFLKTLPERELRSGFAEIIKHCLISDAAKWDSIRKGNLASQNWLDLVDHSVAFKDGVVSRDPREKGERKILNFGHTVGHAVESLSLSGDRLFHGEAIAMGMIAEARIASKKGLLNDAELQQIQKYILEIFGKVKPSTPNEVIHLMKQDKKNKGNKILMALPDSIGKARWDVEVSEDEVREALAYYDSL
ncbi:MAG: 3-dehydroquinate synthase [Bacteroidota bacterium]